jgi:zinc protease
MAGKSPLTASTEQKQGSEALAASRGRGEADLARVVLLALGAWRWPCVRDPAHLWRSDFVRGGFEARRSGSMLILGGVGVARNDPDFMAAFVVNHVLGGGSFSSRLYREVREVRGLAYSVFSALIPLDHAGLFMTGTATRADRTAQTLEVVESEIRRLAEAGPTEEELSKSKSFLTGSYALRFDTSDKIAAQLVQIQLDGLGIDYIDKRNSLVEAVTVADAKRVAKRLLDGGMLVTVVGRPQVTSAKGG